MQIKVINFESWKANMYIVSNQNTALVIDPSYSYEIANETAKKEITAVLITHGHYDHICELDSYVKANVPIYGSVNLKAMLESDSKNCSSLFGERFIINTKYNLIDEKFTINDMTITVYKTPGHTECSVCYVIKNSMFSGDTLFKGSIGRTDLPTGDLTKMVRSLKMLKSLGNSLSVFPGHGESTILLKEKNENYYMRKYD